MVDAPFARIGSVSSGTLRPEDLIPAFADTLEGLVAAMADGPDADELRTLLGDVESRQDAGGEYYASEDADADLDELTDALSGFAPPFAYFGANEGDGADFGFWISWDSIDEAERDGELVKVDAGDEWSADTLPDGVAYVLEVTDHGNASLYTVTGDLLWEVV